MHREKARHNTKIKRAFYERREIVGMAVAINK